MKPHCWRSLGPRASSPASHHASERPGTAAVPGLSPAHREKCPAGLVALTFVLWLLSSISLLADGKAFPPVAISTEVRMPDQRALLVWSNGVERLAIETRIVGEGTNFAWVVPLPAVPQVDATTTGLFPKAGPFADHLLVRPRTVCGPIGSDRP